MLHYLSTTKAKEQEKNPTEETESMLYKEEGIKITLLKTVKRKKNVTNNAKLQVMMDIKTSNDITSVLNICCCLCSGTSG